MNLEQMRARLAAILAKLQDFDKEETLTDGELSEVNELSGEFETLKNQIEAKEKIQAMATPTSSRKVASSPVAAVEVGQDRRAMDPKAGFKTAGEFYRAVAQASSGRQADQRLTIQAGMSEKGGMEEGAFLIPEDFRMEIQKKVNSDESLLPKTRQFKTSSNSLVLPTYELAPWDSTGIQAYWEGEAATHQESKLAFGETAMRLHKLTALVKATDELLEDAPALESFIKSEAPVAIMNKINNAIISGSGVGMPHGFLNSAFKYKVAKESGQSADTVLFANINKMLGRILPQSFAKAVWIVNPAVLPLLREMKFDPSATVPVPVYLPPNGVSEAPYGTLYGRPIMPMLGAVKALGDEGDISLVDLSYFYTVQKTAGIRQEMSTHVYWLSDQTAFKFITRLAGQCPFKAPVSTENGAFSMSGFITLEDR